MHLEWPMLITHAIGFLITLWILKKFAWGPLLSIIEERRTKIAGEFQKIEDEQAKVDQLTEEYQGKLKQIDEERRVKLVEAVNEGKKIAEQIKAEAKTEAKQQSDKAKLELEREVAKAKVQLKDDMVSITMVAAEKLVHEKLDDQKHRELISKFIENLEKA